MKLAVIGSRDFNNYALLEIVLNNLKISKNDIIVSGGAGGADTLAEQYANQYDIPLEILKPDWEKYGKGAGFIRNKEIWDNSDQGIAFWDGKSKGTEHSFKIAKDQNKTLFVVDYVNDKFYYANEKTEPMDNF